MTRETVGRTDATSGTTSYLDGTPAGWLRAAGAILPVLAVVAVAVQLFGLYRAGGPPEAGVFPGVDKVEHLLGFAVPLVLVLLTAWWPRNGGSAGISRRFGVVVTVVFVAQAVVSELVQAALLPMRSGDPLDAVADSLGLILGWGCFALLTRALGRRCG